MAAVQGADERSNELQRLSSLAKTIAGETLHLLSNEAIQMHGGVGVTDEYDLGFFIKRSRGFGILGWSSIMGASKSLLQLLPQLG